MGKKPLKSSLSTTASSSSSPTEMIINSSCTVFSKDLLMDIFSRLPAKSLGKLRCVCKDWRSIISDPFFKSLLRSRSSLKPNFLLQQETNFFRWVTINYTEVPKFGTLLKISSIDLDGNHNFDFELALGGYISSSPFKGELICFATREAFHVCNPSTQQLVKLPDTSVPTRKKKCVYGFGYIKERNEYVLISFFDGKSDGRVLGCEVLRLTDGCCLKDCSWKVVDAKCPCVLSGWGDLVENVFYFMVPSYKNDNYDGVGDIMSFDLDKEEFVSLAPPEGCIASPERHRYLMELKGRLCLVDRAEDMSSIVIWMLKDSKNYAWVKEHSIDLSGFRGDLMGCITVQDYWEGKLLLGVLNLSYQCYEYDVESKSFKRNDSLRSREWSCCRLYTDGLFSLGS